MGMMRRESVSEVFLGWLTLDYLRQGIGLRRGERQPRFTAGLRSSNTCLISGKGSVAFLLLLRGIM